MVSPQLNLFFTWTCSFQFYMVQILKLISLSQNSEDKFYYLLSTLLLLRSVFQYPAFNSLFFSPFGCSVKACYCNALHLVSAWILLKCLGYTMLSEFMNSWFSNKAKLLSSLHILPLLHSLHQALLSFYSSPTFLNFLVFSSSLHLLAAQWKISLDTASMSQSLQLSLIF